VDVTNSDGAIVISKVYLSVSQMTAF